MFFRLQLKLHKHKFPILKIFWCMSYYDRTRHNEPFMDLIWCRSAGAKQFDSIATKFNGETNQLFLSLFCKIFMKVLSVSTNPHNWILILLLERAGCSQKFAFTSKVKQCPRFLPTISQNRLSITMQIYLIFNTVACTGNSHTSSWRVFDIFIYIKVVQASSTFKEAYF